MTRHDRGPTGESASPARPGDAELGQLVALAREALVLPETAEGADENGLQRARSGRRARVRVRWPVVSALAVGAVAAAGVPLAWQLARRPGPLTFEVVHGIVAASGEIRPAAADTRIHFSDGSDIVLGREARTEVRDLAANGGRIVLSRGRVTAHFIPRPQARWQVAAGPYVVEVTGTMFDVEWSDGDQAFDLWLRKGSVRVSGPLIPGSVAMKAGQHLMTRGGDGKILLDADAAATAAGATTAAAPPAESPPQPAPPTATRALPGPASSSSPSSSWSRRLARGDFEAIVADAERMGIGAVLGRGTRPELSALADAARYTRRGDLARRALLAERARFADSAEGRDAAFFLGTLAEDEAAATRWYARYLRDNPTGTYAAQALGRKLLLDETQAPAASHDDAQEYLSRFPNGAHADAARRILAQ
jgi:hypothetical protein